MNHQFNELTKSMAQSVTRRQAFKTFGLGLAGMALMRLGLREAQAITNGQLDGNTHPNVGGFVWLTNIWSPDPPPVFIGTATLIHPRVVLTVGHGTQPTELAIANGVMSIDDLRISFASDARDSGSWRAVSSILTHPDFYAAAQTEDGLGAIPLADLGVVILRECVTGITPAPLPPLGFLDALQAAGMLRSGAQTAKFTAVGYGTLLGDPVGQVPFPPDGLRRAAQSEFLNLKDRWLFLDQNVARGNGGGGTGDSGGPAFWVDPLTGTATLVAIMSRGDDRNRALGVDYRVDTEEALTFLNQILDRVDAGEL